MEEIKKELLLINRRLDAQKIDMEKINARLLIMEQSSKSEKENRVSEKTSKLDKGKRFTQNDIESGQLTYMGCSNDQFQMDSFSSSLKDTQVNDTALTEHNSGASLSTGRFMRARFNLFV